MKTTLILALLAFASFAPAQQAPAHQPTASPINLSSLDKLASKAESVTAVSLDREQLAGAVSMLSGSNAASKTDLASLQSLIKNLNSVQVRSFEFDRKGQFQASDLGDIHAQLGKLKNWSKVIDSKEDGEHSEIYMSSAEGQKGIIVISVAETELSVVVLNGPARLTDLGSLGGVMGLPSMSVGPLKEDEHF